MIKLQNKSAALSVGENGKELVYGESSLRWHTLAEYSFQVDLSGNKTILDAGKPVVDTVAGGNWVRQYEHPEMTVQIVYHLEDAVLIKDISVTAHQPLTIRYARTEIATVAEELTRGGEGQPLFVGDSGFISSTFPVAENCRDGAVLYLRQAPFASLKARETYQFNSVVFGVNTGEGTGECVRSFILSHKPHPKETLRIYCDWGAHDELADEDNRDLGEEMALRLLNNLRCAREKNGLTYDYYLMDAFWYALDTYDHFKTTHWPEGPDRFLKELDKMGMKFGLWFDVNLKKVEEPDKENLRSDTTDELCVAWKANMDRVFSAVERHVREHNVRMLKFDFASFHCNNPAHDFHSQRRTPSKEPGVRNFITHLAALQKEYPDLQVLAYNGFTVELDYLGSVDPNRTGWAVSPFWALYVDYIYCGDPRPAEFPAPMGKSVLHYTDCMIEQFTDALMPREAIDDHGSMIGVTNTIYYLQKQHLRDSYVLNIVRGTRKIHLYGETDLLDDSDWAFLAKAQDLFEFICSPSCRTEMVLERPSRGTVYGYSNTCGNKGYVTAVNTTPSSQKVIVNIPGKLQWKRVYHAGEWCDEALYLEGALDTSLEGFGVDVYEWVRTEKAVTKMMLPPAIPEKPAGGYVEADAGTTVEVVLPADCRRIGIRYLTDNLSPIREQNVERPYLSISADGGKLIRLDTMTVWSQISFAVYSVCSDRDNVVLRFTNNGTCHLILHWQDLTF